METESFVEHFDHLDPDFERDPFPVLAEMRSRCPVAHSDQYGGYWILTKYEDVERVARDHAGFSSQAVMVPRDLFVGPDGQPFALPPLMADPPVHTRSRHVLLPLFSPGQIRKYEGYAREVSDELVDGFIARSTFDGAEDYARIIPIALIARMMGVSDADRDTFSKWVHEIFVQGPAAAANGAAGPMTEMIQYVAAQIQTRREHPSDDIISFMMNLEGDEAPVDDNELMGSLAILLLAGIDTTWSAIGSGVHHLATHTEDRKRLVEALDDPDSNLWDTAVEEFLRAYAPVNSARIALQDATVGGCPIPEGEQVLLMFSSACRDPEMFERPDEVLIDRQHNRHAAFGLGIHRCVGSNLARLELRIALQTLLRRIPDFSVPDGSEVLFGGGQVRGPRRLPLQIDRRHDGEAGQR